jgi:hypothetical protein
MSDEKRWWTDAEMEPRVHGPRPEDVPPGWASVTVFSVLNTAGHVELHKMLVDDEVASRQAVEPRALVADALRDPSARQELEDAAEARGATYAFATRAPISRQTREALAQQRRARNVLLPIGPFTKASA